MATSSASSWKLIREISDTSPAAAGVAASARVATGLSKFDWLLFVCSVTGGTGGTTDITIQGELADDLWIEWARTNAQAATVSAVEAIVPESASIVTVTGVDDDALTAAGVTLATGVCIGGYPGDKVRAVYTAGAGTSAGATQTVRIFGRNRQ
jgi:hypothetical protein